ncbi:MAG: hypothetical protein M3N98_05945, partial [Actinomycetota bacterium]|nr:hypothetical protein [Actinomycetota bacterium]
SSVRRCFSVVGCVTVAVLLSAGPAAAEGGSAGGNVSYTVYNNLVQVDNNRPAVQSVSTASAVSLDSGNAAVQNANLAYSHSFNCTGCRTVTVAIQAVVVQGNPTVLQPQNAAVAVNDSCTSCQTYAYAHQYLFLPYHPVQIDGETRDRLAGIQSAINWVANSGKDFATINGQLDQLSWAFCDTVQRAVQSQQEGEGSSTTTNVCGAAPFDHRQVQEHN